MTLTLFCALSAATASGLALFAAAERDFRLPHGRPPEAESFAGRCYALSFSRPLHRDIDVEERLPTVVRLTATAAYAGLSNGWLLAERADSHAVPRSTGW